MRQSVTKLKQQLLHSISFRVFLALGLFTLAVAWPGLRSAARQEGFQRGDVFVSLGDGRVLRYSQTTGLLLQTLDTGTGFFVTGSAFDRSNNFYATAFSAGTIVKFDANGMRLGDFGSEFNGKPESILFDQNGNALVGTVATSSGDNDVRKLNPNGDVIDNYDVPVERHGSDWIDLAADKCTLYYTSQGVRILRFDICTKSPLPDFVSNLPNPIAYALRLLPGGGLLVADSNEILRLDASGNIIKRYDVAGEDSWFALALDPDGTSFWGAGSTPGSPSSGIAYKFDIESGNQIGSIPTGGDAIFGLSVFGDAGVFPPSPTPTATPTVTPSGSADLSLIKTAAPSVVANGTLLTYHTIITNSGPATAVNVTLTDVLPPGTIFVACTTSGTGTCTGEGNNRGAVFPTVAAGETVTVDYVVRIECASVISNLLTNAAQVTATNPDPNPNNNSANASVFVSPPRPNITIERNPSVLDFGTVQLRREGVANPPSYAFTIENTGCVPLELGFDVHRIGSDVASARISNSADLATFPIAIQGSNGLTFLAEQERVSIPGGSATSFRIFFNPKIPAAAGKTSGLNASQAIPELINSLLVIFTNGPDGEGHNRVFPYPLIGRVTDDVKFINPTAPSLSPLVVIARNGDIFSVEFSVHDPNMDLAYATYQFLNASNAPVGDAPVFSFGEDIARANLVRGQSFTVVKQFTGANRRPEAVKVKVTIFDNLNHSAEVSGPIGSQRGRVVNASAASFATQSQAPESIVAAFGNNLATATRVAATAPLPIELVGTRVSVTDSRSVERAAPLFFVAPGQINYQVPAGTAAGPAVVTVVSGDGAVSTGDVTITPVAPALFTAAATGQGVANGVVLRVRSNGAQSFEPIARFDAPTQRFTPVAIDVSNSSEQVYLVLFGSGIRNRRSPLPVGATVGGVNAPVYYAGSQGSLVGVDQVNLLLPRTLAGRGEVEVRLSVDGRAANPVRVQIR